DVDGVRIPGPVLVDHDVLSAEQVVLLPVARGPAVPDVVEVHGDLRLDALPLELLLDDLLEDELLLLVRHLMPRDRDLHGDVVRVSREDLVVVRTEPGSAEILLAGCTAPGSLRCRGRVLLLDLLGQGRGVLCEIPADLLQEPSGTAGPRHAEALGVRSHPEPLAGPHLPVEGRGVGCQALLRCVDARCELPDLVGVHAEEHRCISWCGERKGPTRPGSDGARLPDLWPVPHASRGVVGRAMGSSLHGTTHLAAQPRAAAFAAAGSTAAIRSRTWSVWAVETNQASKAEGGRYTPPSSIAWKKRVNASVSCAFASS